MNQGAGFRSSHPSPSISRLFLSWNRDVFTLIRDYYLERVCCLSVEGWCLIHHLLSLSVSASCRLFCENPPKRFFGKYRFSNGFSSSSRHQRVARAEYHEKQNPPKNGGQTHWNPPSEQVITFSLSSTHSLLTYLLTL